jgi:hypothetical protein
MSNFQNPKLPPTEGSHLPHAHPSSLRCADPAVPVTNANLIPPEIAEPVG